MQHLIDVLRQDLDEGNLSPASTLDCIVNIYKVVVLTEVREGFDP